MLEEIVACGVYVVFSKPLYMCATCIAVDCMFRERLHFFACQVTQGQMALTSQPTMLCGVANHLGTWQA